MIKTIISITRKLATRLNSTVFWLEKKYGSAEEQSKFVDLAPTDEADKTGVYSEAILFATNNKKVFNIALTGPYGSGKSSIIKTFLKQYRRPALHISLAAFVPEIDAEGEKVSRQEIERSILQQMLYGADANKLPLSRFKRIQSPGLVRSVLKSLFIMLGIIASWYVFYKRDEIVSGAFFVPFELGNWLNLGILFLSVIFFWVTLHHFYVASFGLSLKSISLKDVEIRPAVDDQTSILNRHLDEIVYFFQSTDYELVIIEDIDRFDDAEIFVTLREINSLINDNAGVNRTIRFLYALRDDMFINTDRTKFFEFIIPVIPIINTSNSIDMVLQQGKRLKLDHRLDLQFLREVSRYLNDLRLIQNIFNEYAIYMANLESGGENLLDASKLLAILIYKNVYPSDFEQLHRGVGALAEILNHQDELVRAGEEKLRNEIKELERQLEVAEQQTPYDLKELRQIYAMALIQMLPENVNRIRVDRSEWMPISQLASNDAIEQLIEATRLAGHYPNGQQHYIDVSEFQSEVGLNKSYQQRKKEIESKLADNKSNILRQIRDLRSKIEPLRTTKLNKLLRLNSNRVEDLFEAFGENGELARYLILEGYLDDTYYQYTSLFHSGRLSPHDNKFLIQIRAFNTPEPDFQIDNPKEVIAEMRDEDFRQSYVLNVKLVDSLLSAPSNYLGQTKKFFEFIASEFESCEGFFEAYYTSGRDIEGLLSGLANAWKNLVPTVIASPNNISHVTQMVSNLPKGLLEKLAKDFEELPELVSENLSEILVNSPELPPERLACLDFEVKDLTAIKEHSEIVHLMFEEGRFELTISNLEYIYQAILGKNDLGPMRYRNFTTIRSTNNASLIERVERDFSHYLHDILLALQDNSREDASAILDLIRRDKLDQDDLQKFLEMQTTLLPTLEDVPERLHAVLFTLNMVEPTWMNCLAFMEGDGFKADSLVDYLDRDAVRATILQHSIPGDSDSRQLREFLIGAGSLSDDAYREYVHALPKPFKKLPEGLEPAKLRILIEEEKVVFSPENLDALADNLDLQLRFVKININTYLKDPDNFTVDDDFREELLRSEIDNVAKLGIVELMNLETLMELPERAALIGPIVNSTDANISKINEISVRPLITNSSPIATQISLFNKYHSLMAKEEVRQVLANLPPPYSDIKTGYYSPRLKNTAENKNLVRWLKLRKIISTWSEAGGLTNDIRVNLFRK